MLLLSLALAAPVAMRASLDRKVLQAGTTEERWVVVDLQAPEVTERQAVHLSVAMDTSDSMWQAGKLDYAKAATLAMAQQLGPGDSLSLVGFDTEAEVHVRQGPITNPARFAWMLDLIETGGGTNLFGGMEAALGELRRVSERGRRMVVLSDGQANVGRSDLDSLAGFAASAQREGVSVTALGLGLDFDAETLVAIADAGGGRYHYVNDPDGLAALFAEELDKASRVAARGVRVELLTQGGAEVLEVLGYERWGGQRTDGGWEALIGDLHASEARKVVARVRVPAGFAGGEVAEAVVRWEGQEQRLPVMASVSSDSAQVLGSTDARSVQLVLEGNLGKVVSASTSLRRSGQTGEAEKALEEGLELLNQLDAAYRVDASEEVEELEQELRRQREVQAGSEEERRALDDATKRSHVYMH